MPALTPIDLSCLVLQLERTFESAPELATHAKQNLNEGDEFKSSILASTVATKDTTQQCADPPHTLKDQQGNITGIKLPLAELNSQSSLPDSEGFPFLAAAKRGIQVVGLTPAKAGHATPESKQQLGRGIGRGRGPLLMTSDEVWKPRGLPFRPDG